MLDRESPSVACDSVCHRFLSVDRLFLAYCCWWTRPSVMSARISTASVVYI